MGRQVLSVKHVVDYCHIKFDQERGTATWHISLLFVGVGWVDVWLHSDQSGLSHQMGEDKPWGVDGNELGGDSR